MRGQDVDVRTSTESRRAARFCWFGRLLRHKRLATPAICAHLDGNALQAAAEKAAGQTAKAMGFMAGARTARSTLDGTFSTGTAVAGRDATG